MIQKLPRPPKDLAVQVKNVFELWMVRVVLLTFPQKLLKLIFQELVALRLPELSSHFLKVSSKLRLFLFRGIWNFEEPWFQWSLLSLAAFKPSEFVHIGQSISFPENPGVVLNLIADILDNLLFPFIDLRGGQCISIEHHDSKLQPLLGFQVNEVRRL